MQHDFFNRVRDFNRTFGMPEPAVPTMPNSLRLRQFRDMLLAEVNEYDTVRELEDFADWVGDIIVYCASEAIRHGIPIEQVLKIIMDSNMSKLGEDGKPIINKETGKVEKGPNYWRPESMIQQLLAMEGAER